MPQPGFLNQLDFADNWDISCRSVFIVLKHPADVHVLLSAQIRIVFATPQGGNDRILFYRETKCLVLIVSSELWQ